MALGTISTNQITNTTLKNEDMLASTATNPFRTNANSITSDLTIGASENAGAFGPVTISATITVSGVMTIV